MEKSEQFRQAMALMDAANAEDPNRETADGREWPKELLYSSRMSAMLERYAPEADEVQRLAIHAQHIRRWEYPRSQYPMNRNGYLQWRTHLYKFHAETAAGLLQQAGYDEQSIERVRQAVGKRAVKVNPDTQLLEDVASLVFLEHYLEDFAARHPHYSEEKWIDIIRKTWRKMSPRAHDFVLGGSITLPAGLAELVVGAVTTSENANSNYERNTAQ